MTPEYLNENWTEEMLSLMLLKRAERLGVSAKKMRDTELFHKMGLQVRRR